MRESEGRSLLSSPLALLPLTLLLGAGSALAEVHVKVLPRTEPVVVEATSTPRQLTEGPGILLPYYQFDRDDQMGETTLYAVRNNGSTPVDVTFSYRRGLDGHAAAVEQHTIQPYAVRSVNLRNVSGLGAAATSGYVVIEAAADATQTGLLSGDYFRVDPAGSLANGGPLLDADITGCRRWTHRVLEGGGFDGGTRIAFLVLDGPTDGPTVSGNVYDEDGQQVATVSVTSTLSTFEIAAADLNLPVPFGSIDWVFHGDSHGTVATTFTAEGKFSVGAEASCTEAFGEEPPPDDNATVFSLPGNYLTCNGCGNWQYNMPFGQNRQFSKVTIDFDVYVSGFDPAKPSGFHCIFWLNNGSTWHNMMGYMNSRGTQNRTVFQVNGPLGSPIGVEKYKSPGVQPGQRYHVHYEYDTVENVVWYTIKDSAGEVRVFDSINLPSNTGPISTSHSFIQFGSQPNPGVEALTNGWRWYDFEARWIP